MVSYKSRRATYLIHPGLCLLQPFAACHIGRRWPYCPSTGGTLGRRSWSRPRSKRENIKSDRIHLHLFTTLFWSKSKVCISFKRSCPLSDSPPFLDHSPHVPLHPTLQLVCTLFLVGSISNSSPPLLPL